MPNRPRPLLIFAKAPVPGRVKTRLIPALGAKGACELYIQLLRHSLQQTIDWPAQRYLYAPQIDHPLLQQLAKDHNLPLRQQVGADLGERMANALAEHPDGALLIGTDCPDMSTAVVQQANIALATHDAAVVPSEDGGYVLIAQRQPDAVPFTNMQWSHDRVMHDTRKRLQAAEQSLWIGPTLWDLDDPHDLQRLPVNLRPQMSGTA